MASISKEIQRRQKVALEALKRSFETEKEGSVRLFIDHHLSEIDPGYWKKQLETEKPKPSQVMGLLEFVEHWGEDKDEIENFDFSLPGDVTDYKLNVRFDEAGEIDDIAMES